MKSPTWRHIARIANSNRRHRSTIMLLSALAVLLVLCVGLALRQNGRAATGQEQVLSCPVTGTVAHHHDDSCYDAEGNLACTRPEVERHVHDDSCYQEQTTLVCGQEET
ncbi:MAG: hypothetical protein IJ781_08630, partial [Atopobiaceae bacterium]|nr:hypothetical protein [Atopobiaceae bacterium]